jgi:hypothetical protein
MKLDSDRIQRALERGNFCDAAEKAVDAVDKNRVESAGPGVRQESIEGTAGSVGADPVVTVFDHQLQIPAHCVLHAAFALILKCLELAEGLCVMQVDYDPLRHPFNPR